MPSYVNPDKCDGCKALDKTACQYICPNDLMVLNKEIMKAYNREPEMCWECSILWMVKFRNGTLKRFKFPIRSTPEGSAVPNGGFESTDDLSTPLLFTEPASNGLEKLGALA